MQLAGLLPLINEIPAYGQFLKALKEGKEEQPLLSHPLALPASARPYFLAALHQDVERPILVLVARAEKARQLFEELCQWSSRPQSVLHFPEPEALPYEHVAWSTDTIKDRLTALTALAEWKPGRGIAPLVVASARALLQKTLPLREFRASLRPLRRGEIIPPDKLLASWYALGYRPAEVVEEPGTFCRRGGIVDVFPPASPWPARLEFFGDQIDSIRLFDPLTQRSREQVESVLITPAREGLPRHAGLALKRLKGLDLSPCHPPAETEFKQDLKALEHNEPFRYLEFYPYLYSRPGILLDYLPPEGLLLIEDWPTLEAEVQDLLARAERMRSDLIKAGELPEGLVSPCFAWGELEEALLKRKPLFLGYSGLPSSPSEEAGGLGEKLFLPGPRYGGQIKRFLDDCLRLQGEGARVVVVSRQAQRISSLLEEHLIYTSPLNEIREAPPPGHLTLVHGTLSEGWILRTSIPCYLLTDAEIFGWSRPMPRRPRRKRALSPEAFFADLTPGDYVVHIEHGIGVFRGLTRLEVDGVEREYLLVEYAAGDKLYVPVHQADRLSRYVGVSDEPPTVHRLGTADWNTVKRRAKRAVEDLARELLELYSAREVMPGHAFSPDTAWQEELEASFPYIETEDQLKAVKEIKADMEKPRPMDRLVCGDVGYGKTEVALRAAFKAVMDGKQVAVLVPTTVLAQQHFNTFRERLKPFPVEVEMLSRFRSRAEQERILKGLREGTVDIVIGTHRLLQKDVVFKDLGLVIIDEEQRFGVAHKERLKKLRKEVDVLTLTATPIPRTLYMSLTGIRDMSTIETPPEERLPVKTHLAPYDETLIRRAILRELERGGQVYFIHNRIQGIEQIAQRLRRLVPEARIAVAHGRMREKELAKVMTDFAQGKIDVLVSTAIVESGLDIPNANTIIVNDAHRFGLADLHQLRGRVGRSAMRAYAYFLYPRGYRLSEVARRRLEAILEASDLGAGFRIAMKDLEIRGAGEILGARQHGHIAAIGFELYCRLLAQAVQELREKEGLKEGKEVTKELLLAPSVSVDLPLPSFIPKDYVPEETLRLQLYRRLARLTKAREVKEVARELEDRFGKMPAPVRNLLYQLLVKTLALSAGVQSILVENGQLILRTGELEEARRRKLAKRLGKGAIVGREEIRVPLRRRGNWRRRLVALLRTLASLSQDRG